MPSFSVPGVVNKSKLSFLCLSIILFIIPYTCFTQNLNWTEVAPSIWKTEVGKPEAYNLLTAAGVNPNLQAISVITQANFPFQAEDVVLKIRDGKTYIRLPLDREEQIYGFGLH